MTSSPPTLQLDLDADGDPPVVDPSEPLRGTARIEVDEDVDCDALVLRRVWTTDGRGESDSGGEAEEVLFDGEWTAGEQYEYPFEMELPPGPYTYDGHEFGVTWRLELEADLSWSGGPETSTEFILEPGGADEYVAGSVDGGAYERRATDEGGSITWSHLVLGLALTGFGGVMISPALEGNLTICGGIGVGAFGLFLVYFAVRNAFARLKLGSVDLELEPHPAHPGDELECRVVVDPPGTLDLNLIRCGLFAYERVETRVKHSAKHGTKTDHHRHTLHRELATLDGSESATVDGGAPEAFSTSFELPEMAAYSFEAPNNELFWEVLVQIELPMWPDWSRHERFLVRPRSGTRSAAEHTSPETG